MSLDDVVQLTITKQTSVPSRLGFGIPMFACYHTVAPDLVIPVKSLQAVTDAGFAVTDPAYLACTVAFSQNPRPSQVIIGKRTTPYVKTIRIGPLSTQAGFVYKFTVVDTAGVKFPIQRVVPGSSSIAAECTAIAALITAAAPTGITTTATATYVQLVGASGKLFNLTGLPKPAAMSVTDTTADPGLTADLAAIALADSTTWYGMTLDSQSPAEIAAAAAWTEARRKLFLANVTNSDVLGSGTSDIGSTLKLASYSRTGLLFCQNQIQPYSALGWMARQLPKDPGSSTWKFKSLAGIPSDTFTDAQTANMRSKNVNFYNDVGGLPITEEGWDSDGEYVDVIHGVDWLYARIQEAVYGLLASQEKIPFTDAGVASLVNVLSGVLQRGVKAGLLAKGSITITAPKVADVDVALRATRTLPDVVFTATLAGAVHSVIINGTVSV